MKHTKVSISIGLMILLSAVVLASGCVPQLEGIVTLVTPTPSPLPPTTIPLPTTPIELCRTDFDGYQSRLARDISYVPDGNSYQKLDVYLPTEGEGPFPTVLAIHGGCFQGGNKNSYLKYASFFNKLGYALVSIDYRLAPRFTYPVQVQDSFCALAWIHANAATYGFDTERIIAMGDSAGGYLVAMLGTVETPSLYMEGCPHTLPETDWVHGIIPFYGLFNLTSTDGYTDWVVHKCLEPYLGTPFSDIPAELLTEMSPISWVNGSEPPFLLIHGLSDTYLPASVSEDFALALEEVGAEVELLLIEGLRGSHGFITSQSLSSPGNVQSLEAIETFRETLFEER